MMLLAWAQEIVGGFLSIFGVDRESQGSQTSVIVFAAAFVYILDFAINVSKYHTWPMSRDLDIRYSSSTAG